jgi:hypothetical protein
MNVLITDDGWMYVSNPAKDANVNVYRMFEAVWCIFTKQFFIIPYSHLHGVQNETKPVSS